MPWPAKVAEKRKGQTSRRDQVIGLKPVRLRLLQNDSLYEETKAFTLFLAGKKKEEGRRKNEGGRRKKKEGKRKGEKEEEREANSLI